MPVLKEKALKIKILDSKSFNGPLFQGCRTLWDIEQYLHQVEPVMVRRYNSKYVSNP